MAETEHGHIFHQPTITEVMFRTIRDQLNHPNPDVVSNIETHLFNVLLIADSCEFELDVGKQLWLNKQRWSRLIREYVSRHALHRFIDQSKEIMSGKARDGATCNMMFRDPKRYATKHRWGGCLMGVTFIGPRSDGSGKPTITFLSRTTYIGYMGLLDAGIAHVMARYICGDPSQIAFRWLITSSQLHAFKTLPLIFSDKALFNRLQVVSARVARGERRDPPTWIEIAKWYNKLLKAWETHGMNMLEAEKYGPFKRIKRRWMEHMGYLNKNIPPSLSIQTLNFEKSEIQNDHVDDDWGEDSAGGSNEPDDYREPDAFDREDVDELR